jgi:hypothetical protein
MEEDVIGGKGKENGKGGEGAMRSGAYRPQWQGHVKAAVTMMEVGLADLIRHFTSLRGGREWGGVVLAGQHRHAGSGGAQVDGCRERRRYIFVR